MFKNYIQHKFAVIGSYGNEKTKSNIIETEYKKEFQHRLESRQITQKYRNLQEITDKIFGTCSSMSKVENNQLEITKEEVQSAIKMLIVHKCYDPAGLKNEVFKSGGDWFLNSITKVLNCVLKEKQPPEQWEEVNIRTLYKGKR